MSSTSATGMKWARNERPFAARSGQQPAGYRPATTATNLGLSSDLSWFLVALSNATALAFKHRERLGRDRPFGCGREMEREREEKEQDRRRVYTCMGACVCVHGTGYIAGVKGGRWTPMDIRCPYIPIGGG